MPILWQTFYSAAPVGSDIREIRVRCHTGIQERTKSEDEGPIDGTNFRASCVGLCPRARASFTLWLPNILTTEKANNVPYNAVDDALFRTPWNARTTCSAVTTILANTIEKSTLKFRMLNDDALVDRTASVKIAGTRECMHSCVSRSWYHTVLPFNQSSMRPRMTNPG